MAGTAAMFLVGGGILTHGVPVLHRIIEDFGDDAGDIPGIGAVVGALTPMALNAIAGLLAGAIAYAALASDPSRSCTAGSRRRTRRQATAGARRRLHISHSADAAMIASTGSAARFIVSQPVDVTSAPDANDDTPIVAKTMRSLSPACAISRWVDTFRSAAPFRRCT